MNYSVKHTISLGVLLFALWLALSGQLNVLMLSLGLGSTLVIVYISHRMDVIDQEKYPAHMTVLLVTFLVIPVSRSRYCQYRCAQTYFQTRKKYQSTII